MRATRQRQKAAVETMRRAHWHTFVTMILKTVEHRTYQVARLVKSLFRVMHTQSRLELLAEIVAELPDGERELFGALLEDADNDEAEVRERIATIETRELMQRVMAAHYSK